MMRAPSARSAGLIATAVLLALGARASAQGTQSLTIAIYAPNAPFASATARVDYVDRLAAQIQAQTGTTTQGQAFAYAADLEAAIAGHKVDLAILDPQYEAEHVDQYPVLAAAVIGGGTNEPWGLLSSAQAKGLDELQGKRLAMVSVGHDDTAFLENALLSGEVSLAKYFAAGPVEVNDVASAVQAVSLKRADVVLAPVSMKGSLTVVFQVPGIPTAALAQVNSKLAPALVEKVQSAVVSYGGADGFSGWRSSGSGPYGALAANMQARSKDPVFIPPDPVRLEATSVLKPMPIDLPLPGLADQLWLPATPK
jgi:hypothetical protein